MGAKRTPRREKDGRDRPPDRADQEDFARGKRGIKKRKVRVTGRISQGRVTEWISQQIERQRLPRGVRREKMAFMRHGPLEVEKGRRYQQRKKWSRHEEYREIIDEQSAVSRGEGAPKSVGRLEKAHSSKDQPKSVTKTARSKNKRRRVSCC